MTHILEKQKTVVRELQDEIRLLQKETNKNFGKRNNIGIQTDEMKKCDISMWTDPLPDVPIGAEDNLTKDNYVQSTNVYDPECNRKLHIGIKTLEKNCRQTRS
ncbi:hypothetical protein JTB14_027984 [Gonioctena quinquepunctata]|nr:hypothetical protein JTB14_027984 [Gonioctena quinquepunctata]